MAPGSLVRSSTATTRVVAGKAERKASTANGLNNRTLRSPTFSPVACRMSIVSSTAFAAEPIKTITLSASRAPVYSKR